MLPVTRSARSPMVKVDPVIFSAMNASASVLLRSRSLKSGHETSSRSEPRFVPVSATNRSWSTTRGYGRRRMPSIQLNTAAVAPIPTVRHTTARIEKPGFRRSIRSPKRRS